MTIADGEYEDDGEYELGDDVTSLAAGKSAHPTAVLVVRLSLDELSRVESMSRETGETPSQMVREALANYLRDRSKSRRMSVSADG